MTTESTRAEARAADVRDGARVRVSFRGLKSTVAGTPTVTTEDGLSVALPMNLVVVLMTDALPETAGSVVRASVNGGPDETLVLSTNPNDSSLRWRRSTEGGFVRDQDEIDSVRVLYQAPAPIFAPVRGRGRS